eukprot:2100752-Pyramimonas_sp.AAC.1
MSRIAEASLMDASNFGTEVRTMSERVSFRSSQADLADHADSLRDRLDEATAGSSAAGSSAPR